MERDVPKVSPGIRRKVHIAAGMPQYNKFVYHHKRLARNCFAHFWHLAEFIVRQQGER
jgi:hypothetical protein